MTDKTIHVAYGFHVNCYHSYRGDTNDALGFGSDIRIIRGIIRVLNELCESGIPVKGTWDSENFFSLEQILPQYAPDIIDGMRERVQKYGDENIIMGYSNGALGAMNDAELTASVELALTNAAGSGLVDLFGTAEKIVRPQEVMFSPSQVSVYNKLGVKALCLYNSCVPFDAMRTIIPPLPDEWAFNPLTYTYRGESMTVLPTYSNSDVCDAGCLRAWVKELREKQESGEITHDLFLFINMDADAIFWESMKLPVVGSRIANTDGIHGLVTEIADLPYVVFDTPGGYLREHAPLGKIDFTQDTADGNFTGYASWAEKPYNRKIWTAVERSRALSEVNAAEDAASVSFLDRVKLLSTTHFGLATPVLNIQREKKADALASCILRSETAALPKTEALTIHNITHSDFQCVQLSLNAPLADVSALRLSGEELTDYAVVPMDGKNRSVFLLLRFSKVCDTYTLVPEIGEPAAPQACLELSTGALRIKFSVTGKPYQVDCLGKEIGDETFLKSFLTYDGKAYAFSEEKASVLPCGGSGQGLRAQGAIHLPGELSAGSYCFDFFTVPFSEAIFVRTEVHYPYTAETTAISTENSSLGRFTDNLWQEAVPFQLTPRYTGDLRVVKRNFSGDVSSFRTASFGECDEKNRSLASFNHQLTGGFTGLTDGEAGLALAVSRQVLNSMACCPMRLDADKTVHMNPFGTYFGPQRHHRGRAKDQILKTYTLITPQGRSLAPSYNGTSETAVTALYGFSGNEPEGAVLREMTAFADGAVATAPENSLLTPFTGENVGFRAPCAQKTEEQKLKSPIAMSLKGNFGKYLKYGSKAIGHIVFTQWKARK